VFASGRYGERDRMMNDAQHTLMATTSTELSRRRLIQVAAAGAGMTLASALLAACADTDDDTEDPAVEPVDDDEDPDETDDTEADDAVAPEPDDTEIVVAQGPEITSLDGSISCCMLVLNVIQHVSEPLLHRNNELVAEPFLAVEVEQVDDLTVHITIRDDVQFHDGEPLTVDDVVFTLERVRNPESESGLSHYLGTLDTVQALDDRTIEVTLTAIDATFIQRLALIPIVPQHVIEEVGDAEFDAHPVGTGAYRFVEWRRGERVTFEAFDGYWGPQPHIQRLAFRGIPEDATRVAELQTGAVHIITNVPNHLVPEIEGTDGIHIKTASSLRTQFAPFNSFKEPFSDVRMRQAANYAVDIDLLVEELFDGFARPTTQPYGAEVFGYNPDLEGYYAYNPDEARRLMEEAGYGDGVDINFVSPSGRYLRDVDVAQFIAAQLEDVGFRVNLQFMEFGAYFDRFFAGGDPSEEMDILFWSNANNTADADYNLTLNVHSVRGQTTYWNDAEVDDLIDAARQSVDQDERLSIYHRIAEIMVVEQAAWLFMYNQSDIYGVSDRLANWEPRSDEMIYLRDIQLVD
jgi:peptide/nickel transport system substrate-binding protein